VRGGAPAVVGPELEEVADVHDQRPGLRNHRYPCAVDVDLQAPAPSAAVCGVVICTMDGPTVIVLVLRATSSVSLTHLCINVRVRGHEGTCSRIVKPV
jgi:hypothetical protein